MELQRSIGNQAVQRLIHSPYIQRKLQFGTLQRTPAAPTTGGNDVPFDRSKIDVAVPDVSLDTDANILTGMFQTATLSFIDPAIRTYSLYLYDPADQELSAAAFNNVSGRSLTVPVFDKVTTPLTQGRHILRVIGYDPGGTPIAYADRSFFIWRTAPTGKPPDIAALEAQKTALEAITKTGSGKEFGEVAGAIVKLQEVTHRLGILTTGTGPFVGSQCPIQPAGSQILGCTNSVLIVLEQVFAQQGRSADWAKVKKKMQEHTKSRGKKAGLEGWDIQAALQSEVGWKGIFWAPDPKYQVPKEHLTGARSDEAGYAALIAEKKGVYKEKGRPTVSIAHSVTNYAPEAPNAGFGTASTTTKDVTQLDKLKKLPFGVLSAHGAYHMAFIIYGKVFEVHWDKEATDVNLFEQTDLEKWAVGPSSGYHYFASGAIVAPAADVDAAFK